MLLRGIFQDPLETRLSQWSWPVSRPREVRRCLADAVRASRLDVSARAPVRLPQEMQPAPLPGTNGETLVSCLYAMRETERQRFETVEYALRAAFPGFQRLAFPPVGTGTRAITWRDRTSRHPLYANQLSDGILRFLWLATLLASPGLPPVCMIDEPELGLHGSLLGLIADLMREASRHSLIMVTTHSESLVRCLKPEEVLVVDSGEDSAATVKWADSLDLAGWLDGHARNEIRRLDRLGAR